MKCMQTHMKLIHRAVGRHLEVGRLQVKSMGLAAKRLKILSALHTDTP